MKKYLSLIAFAGCLLTGCNAILDEPGQQMQTEIQNVGLSDEIVFETPQFETKASSGVDAVTTVTNLYVAAKATTGNGFASTLFTKGADTKYHANPAIYWPSTDPGYTFYAANAEVALSSGKYTISASTISDLVYCVAAGVYKGSTSLQMKHIYARLGKVTLNSQEGYELSGVTLTLKSVHQKGTFTLPAGTTGNGTWTASDAAADLAVSNGDNDLYVVPGIYDMTVSYTLKKGTTYSESFTKTAKDLDISQGNITTVTMTAVGGAAAEITFDVTVTAWENNALTPTLS